MMDKGRPQVIFIILDLKYDPIVDISNLLLLVWLPKCRRGDVACGVILTFTYRPFDASYDYDHVSDDNCAIPVTMDAIPVLQHSMVNTYL